MEKTLIYHYTSLSHLIEIFRVGKVLTSQTEKMLKVKKPGLWFSTNSKWEHSAFKRFNDGKKEFDLNTPEEFEKYIGCARLVTNLNSLFVTFAKYKHKSKVNPLLWDKMAEIGKSKGADPTEWYATFSPISINNLDIEVYENGQWYNLKKEGGEFDSDLFNRNLEKTFVFKQGKEMEEKMLKEQQANQPIAVKKDNESNAPIEEKVIEKEVVEEKVVEEKVVEKKVVENKVVEYKVHEKEGHEDTAVEEQVVEKDVVEEKVVEKEVIEEKVVEEKVVEEKKTKSKGLFSKVKSFFSKK